MKPVNGIFIRPLLCLKRQEIEAWLRHQQIGWCTDSTNSSDHYTRNRIRNHIIPMLEEMVNPKAVVHLQEMMTQMQCLKDYVDLQTEAAWEICVCRE